MADIDALSRETDDVYKLVFGLYEVWVSKKGRLKPPVNVNGLEWGCDGDRWMTDFKVPVIGKFPVYPSEVTTSVCFAIGLLIC